jgi:FKBP-type peptidyl-prolyl cis-trans isomerase FkpA
MKQLSTLIIATICTVAATALPKDSTIACTLPDSVKAMGFIATIYMQELKGKASAGIRTSEVTLAMGAGKKSRYVELLTPVNSTIIATGQQVKKQSDGALVWKTDWKENTSYKLFIATASDSAGNFTICSGYIFLPEQNKWKLIGSCKINKWMNSILQPAAFFSDSKKTYARTNITQLWCQRSNGSWKNMQPGDTLPPVLAPFSNIDSVQQFAIDISMIDAATKLGSNDARSNINGVYYTMMKEGTGRNIAVTDTLTVFYKGYLFADGSVFDETKEKPATFPLARLIKGWQVGLTQCKVGGKIKLLIPSGLAYSIRTRAPKIPPNSVLVFEIEVVAAK